MPTRRTAVSGHRSAITPPKSRNNTIGVVPAASTRPSALGESLISSTANARATADIVVPARFTVRAIQYHRKFACCSGARLPESCSISPGIGVRRARGPRAYVARPAGVVIRWASRGLRMLPSSTITVGMSERLSVPRSERKSRPSPPAM